MMELEDCAFPLLAGMIGTADPKVAFKDAQQALLVGAKPRGPGMERKDLLLENAKIFIEQGKAIDEVAARDLKLIVVGNPANTNALITMNTAKSLPRSQFTSMMRLDHNRAISQLATRTKASRSPTSRRWSSGATIRRPCIRTSASPPSPARPPRPLVNDEAWYKNEYIPKVGKRGAAIIEARGLSSAASAANAAIDHMRDWTLGTNGKWVTMGVVSDGSYGIPEGMIYGMPCTCADGKWQVVKGLDIDAFSREKMDFTLKELHRRARRRQALASSDGRRRMSSDRSPRMTHGLHPADVLYRRRQALPPLAACEHYAG